MSMTKAEILEALNTAYNALGYGAGNDPVEITEENVSLIGALPDSQVQPFFGEINKILVERWFTNAINPSAKGLFRFIIRDNGGHGFGIIDRFVNLISGTSYPSTAADIAADLVSPADNPVDVKRYTQPYEPGHYKATIMRQQLRKFLSPGGMEEYISQVEANLFNSAEFEMLLEVANMMKGAVEGDNVVVDPTIDMNTEGGLATLCEKMMTAYDAFRQPTASYNKGERVMSTPDGADVVIVTTPSRWNRLKARLFADRYNLAQIYIDGKVLFAPEGTDLGTYTYEDGGETKTAAVQFIVTDARGFCLDIKTLEILPFVVSNMNYINQFLHVEGVEGSVPTFCNCIAFAGEFGSFSG